MSNLVRKLKDDLAEHAQAFSGVHRLMGREYEFACELKQYREQRQTDSGRRVQPTDQGIFRLGRYIAALTRLRAPVHIDCEPKDNVTDPEAARLMQQMMEHETIGKPWKGFRDVRHRWIESAVFMRAGAYRWDWRPDMGKFGEIVPRLVDPRNLIWPAGYTSPHDPYNPRLYEVFRMPIALAQKMRGWKHTRGLKPDDGVDMAQVGSGAKQYNDVPGSIDWSSYDDDNATDLVLRTGAFTGALCWMRYEDGYVPPARKYEEGERFLECPACGFKSKPEGELAEFADGFRYPEAVEDGCPQCGYMLLRADSQDLDGDARESSKGKRLVVICLNGSVNEPLFDGGWTVPYCRTFPYAWLTRYRSPVKAIPESDVSLNVSVVTGINFTKRVLYEQAHRSRGLWLMPHRGLEDRNGARYDFGDDQDDVAFYQDRHFPASGVQHVQAAPVNAALFNLHNLLEGAFRSNEGSSDINLTPERSKDIPVGTVERLTETGNVPIDDFIQDVYEAESLSFSVLADMIRYTKTRAEMVRMYGPEGEMKFETIRGMDLPDVDVTVNAGPSLSRVRAEDVDTFTKLAGLPAPQRRVLGNILGVDRNLLQQMDQAEQETQALQMQQAMQGAQLAAAMPQPNGNGNGKPRPANRAFAREQR